jgi:ClpP class serine protease
MTAEKLNPKHIEEVDEIIARVRRLKDYDPPTSTFEKEIILVLQADNEKLVAEIERLRQVVSDLRSRLRVELVTELEKQFPRKRRKSPSSRR